MDWESEEEEGQTPGSTEALLLKTFVISSHVIFLV